MNNIGGSDEANNFEGAFKAKRPSRFAKKEQVPESPVDTPATPEDGEVSYSYETKPIETSCADAKLGRGEEARKTRRIL
jgi:hypothetical protein